MTQPSPGAGWFPDPSDPSRQRYFDGKIWTENYAPAVPPPPPPNVPAPKKKGGAGRIILIAGLVVFGLVVIGSLGDSDDKDAASKSSSPTSIAKAVERAPTAEPETRDAVAPAGSAVRDRKFEFQVLGVERSTSKEGLFSPEQAKGEFFIVHLRVTNIGDDARSFSASSQHLIVNGNKYDATTSISDENWLEDINPGLSIEASVTFDIPPGAVPEAIECHDSMFSGGALLAL